MDFLEIVEAVADLVQGRKRVTYRTLQRQFDLSDEVLADLKDELFYSHPHIRDDVGRGLIWDSDDEVVQPVSTAAPPVAEAERRQLTVMFCDLVGSTTLSGELDPEELREVVQAYQTAVSDVIQRLDGYIAQYLGDGVLVYFGYPRAHEDDAQRAVRASLGVVDALTVLNTRLEADHHIRLAVRIGLHTGLVVVGEMGGSGRREQLALGETPNIAARLQGLAEANAVVMSAATHRAVSDLFDVRGLGQHQVKGVAAPLEAYEVIRPRGPGARLAVAAERGRTRYIGRAQELETLQQQFLQVKAGAGRVVCVAGEAGMGKSRLLFECWQGLSQLGEPMTWLEGRCLSFGQSIPFLPIVDQLRTAFGLEDTDDAEAMITKINRGLERLGVAESHQAAMRFLLSVDSGNAEFEMLEPAVRRKRVFDALLAMSTYSAQAQPLVLVYEDLHWVDTSTETFIQSLTESLADHPILLILSYRPGYVPVVEDIPVPCTTLTLQKISQQETLRMASRLLNTDELPSALKAWLLEKTDGIPLFIEEVIQSLVDTQVLVRVDETYEMVSTATDLQVSDTLQGLIMARLDRLSEGGRRTAQQASVVGRQFLSRLLEKISDLSLPLDPILEEIQAVELIYRQRRAAEPVYIFKHALIQDVAYNSLLMRRRRELHRAVAEAMEELYAERLAEHYEELAHHFIQAEMWPQALDYSSRSGDRAAAAFSNVEAKAHYARALDAASRLSPPPDTTIRVQLRAKYGAILMVLGEDRGAIESYQQALTASRESGNTRLEIEMLLGLSQVYAYYHRGEPAIETIDQALALCQSEETAGLRAACLANRAFTRTVGYGQMVESVPDIEEALVLTKEIENPKLQAQVLVDLGTLSAWRGQYEQSLAYLHEGGPLAERLQTVFLRGRALFFAGNSKLALGEYEAALQLYDQLDAYASDAGNTYFICRVPNLVGGLHLELFNLDEALDYNLEGCETARRLFPWPEPEAHSLLKVGLVYLLRQEYDQANAYFGQTESLLEEDEWLRWRWHMALLRAQGMLALAQGQLDNAGRLAEQSLALAIQTDSQKHVARAQRLQGEVWAAHGRAKEAAERVAMSIRVAEAIQSPPEIWMGKALLGTILMQVGQNREAERQLQMACQTIETLARDLHTPRLRQSFLTAPPVQEVYQTLGRKVPIAI